MTCSQRVEGNGVVLFCWHIHDPDSFITAIYASLKYSRPPGYTDNAAPTSVPRYPQVTEPVHKECLLSMLFRMI